MKLKDQTLDAILTTCHIAKRLNEVLPTDPHYEQLWQRLMIQMAVNQTMMMHLLVNSWCIKDESVNDMPERN